MKKINKKLLTSIAGIVLLSIGFVSLSSESSSIASVQKVNAATTKVQLKSNAYVYTKQGVRKRVKSLKKGRILNAYSLVTIKGTKYYNIGKGRYIKKTNVQKRQLYISLFPALCYYILWFWYTYILPTK